MKIDEEQGPSIKNFCIVAFFGILIMAIKFAVIGVILYAAGCYIGLW